MIDEGGNRIVTQIFSTARIFFDQQSNILSLIKVSKENKYYDAGSKSKTTTISEAFQNPMLNMKNVRSPFNLDKSVVLHPR